MVAAVPRFRRPIGIAASAAMLTFCGDGGPRNRAPALPEGRLTAELRIDGHEHDLVPISFVAVARDGTLGIGQPQDHRIRFFDAGGRPLAAVGRRGAGPGEFNMLAAHGWYADTLWVHDFMLNRITLISPERALVRTAAVPVPARPAPVDEGRFPTFRFVVPAALLAGGGLFAQLQPVVGEPLPEPFRERVSYGRLSAEGVLESIAATLPAGDASLQVAGGVASVPFGNRAWVGMAPDGSRLAVAFAPVTGDEAGTIRVTVIGTEGDTLFVRWLPVGLEAIPAAARDSAIAASATRMRAGNPAMANEFERRVRVPEFFPPVSGVVVGNDGTVWIELRARELRRSYLVLRPDGEPLGRIELPSNARIAAAALDRVWTIERDELDVGSVVRHAVAW